MRILIAATVMVATAAHAQKEDLYHFDEPLPEKAEYMCALDHVTSIENGRVSNVDEREIEALKRPMAVSIPRTDAHGLFAEGMSKDGNVYGFIMQENDGMARYIVHGTFDLRNRRLVTSRSGIFPTAEGDLLTQALSFSFWCTER